MNGLLVAAADHAPRVDHAVVLMAVVVIAAAARLLYRRRRAAVKSGRSDQDPTA